MYSTWPSNAVEYTLREEGKDNPITNTEPAVPLSHLLRGGSIAMAVICTLSITLWAFTEVAVIGPFAAILIIAVTPLFYVMGSMVEKGNRK